MHEDDLAARRDRYGLPRLRKLAKVIVEIDVVLRIGNYERCVWSIKNVRRCRQVRRRYKWVSIFVVVHSHPVIAGRRIGDTQHRVAAGCGNDARLAVECKSILYFADKAEVAG